MKDGTDHNVFADQDITKLKEFVEHVTLIHIIMVEIVFVTMDSLEMLINVKSVMKAVENVQDQRLMNVLHVQMLVMILLMDTVKENLLALLVSILMENNVNLALLIVVVVSLKMSVLHVLKVLN